MEAITEIKEQNINITNHEYIKLKVQLPKVARMAGVGGSGELSRQKTVSLGLRTRSRGGCMSSEGHTEGLKA